jgi:hypothetical protein
MFDNWPHPDGLVPAHETLAAALHHQSGLVALKEARREDAPPVFVLDSNRLREFKDGTHPFDNRYTAQLPPAEALAGLGITEVLYVTPRTHVQEADDLNAAFVAYADAGVPVKVVHADDFIESKPGEWTPEAEATAGEAYPAATEEEDHPYRSHHVHRHYYGGFGSHWFLWSHLGWGRPRYGATAPGFTASTYRPQARPTLFSGRGADDAFGKVAVRKSSATGGVSYHSSQAKPSSPSYRSSTYRSTSSSSSSRSTSSSSSSRSTSSWGRTSSSSSSA